MGTRGMYAYRYRGKYYCRHNPCDSYPSGLGRALIAHIPVDPEAFQRWLEVSRKIVSTFEGQGDESGDDEPELNVWDAEYDDGLHGEFEYSPNPPSFNDWDAGWMYIYDLDNEAFTIRDLESTIHFRLDNIPRGNDNGEWIKYMHMDTLERFCRSPFAPEEHYAEVDSPEKPYVDPEDVQLFEETHIHNIDPTTWLEGLDGHFQLLREVAVIAALGIIGGLYSKFTDFHEQQGDGVSKNLAMELLTAATPAGSVFSFERQRSKGEYPIDQTINEQFFWFRCRLIVLANRLDINDVYKSYVGMVIRRVQDLGLQECTVILWSAHHVAAVVISGERISCSEVIPVVAAFGKDDQKLKEGLRLIAYYLPPPISEGRPLFSSRLPLEVFLRILDFTDPESNAMLGRTSKALRIEWLKRPAIGHFNLLSSLGDGGFMVEDTKRDESPVKISIRPPKTVPYDEWNGRAGFDSHVVFGDAHMLFLYNCYRKVSFDSYCGFVCYQVASRDRR